MKRVFTFALVMGLAFSAFAQKSVQRVERTTPKVAQTEVYTGFEQINKDIVIGAQAKNMMTAPEEIEIGQTYYDWQTNAAARN